MTTEELANLQPGDIIRHGGCPDAMVVTASYGGRATAVRSVDVTNASEWKLVRKHAGTVGAG